MKAGDLRCKVSFQKMVETVNEYGEPVKSYVDFATAWAAIKPYLPREPFDEKMFHSETTHRIQVRYQPGLEATMRIVYNGKFYNVLGLPSNWQERNILLFFNVQEVIDGNSTT